MTATERLMGATPAWQADPPPEVVIRHRSGSVSSRRPYPAARNDRFIPNRPLVPGFSLTGVGEGNDVFLDPDPDAEAGSEEARNRIKRLKNVGAGVETLVDQQEGDTENKLRTTIVSPGALLSLTQMPEENELDSTGVSSTAQINIDGIITTVRGIVSVLTEGRRGGTGNFGYTRCGGSRVQLFSWENGLIPENGEITVDVGDCGSTDAPGP